MASQKNQHFVPKVCLAPFSTNGDGKSISLFNVARTKLIQGAPIKHQCSGDYFYGQNTSLENLFAEAEGIYAEIVREIRVGKIRQAAHEVLTDFMALQACRTRYAFALRAEMLEKAEFLHLRCGESVESKLDVPRDALINRAMDHFKSLACAFDDLSFCVLHNRTSVPFVTSDNPLVTHNRFYTEILGRDDFDSLSPGAAAFLPLDPYFVACLYDTGVYRAETSDGYVKIDACNDVLALNEMQYMNCDQNVYFSNPANGVRVATEFSLVSGLRPKSKTRLVEYMKQPDGRRRIVEVDFGKNRRTAGLASLSIVNVRLRRWPSVFEIYPAPRVHGDDVGLYLVRHSDWLTKEGRQKLFGIDGQA